MSKYEKSVIEFEAARNEAMKKYLDARPQLFVTREKECFFEAGFRMAWELNQARISELEKAYSHKYNGTGDNCFKCGFAKEDGLHN